MKKALYHIILCLLIAFGSVSNSSVFAADNLAGTYGTEFWLAFLSNKNAAPEDLTITFYAVAEEPMTISAYSAGKKISDFTLDEKSPNYFYKLEKVSANGLCPVDNESEQIKNRGIRIASNGINKKFSCYALIETGGKGDKSQRVFCTDELRRWYVHGVCGSGDRGRDAGDDSAVMQDLQ